FIMLSKHELEHPKYLTRLTGSEYYWLIIHPPDELKNSKPVIKTESILMNFNRLGLRLKTLTTYQKHLFFFLNQ
ncbi:hypothetical protein, partial [Klebsiella variicola]|uniref:hypothetical protein n=1 Tax=Klebsiella variicola TaxID=244366 RepID=UPI001CCAF004